jgi:chaperonin GroES
LFIPEKAQETLNEGVVIEVGPGVYQGKELTPVAVAKGDLVLLPPYGGTSVKLGNEEYHLFKDSEILAKLTKE